VHITLSHQLSGRLGLLERESAAVLNASLAPLAAAVIPQYAAALQQLGLRVPLYITGAGDVPQTRKLLVLLLQTDYANRLCIQAMLRQMLQC
jgi:hypothetical protein